MAENVQCYFFENLGCCCFVVLEIKLFTELYFVLHCVQKKKKKIVSIIVPL